MPSLNLDLDYFTHPKVMRLVAHLGEAGLIIPIRLWCYVAKHHAETGKLVGYSKAEIEQIVGWHGPSGECVDALVNVRLLEPIRAHRSQSSLPQNAQTRPESYAVHDWAEHAGHLAYYKRRAKSGAKARWQKYQEASNPDASSNASINALTLHPISSHPISSQYKKKDDDAADDSGAATPTAIQVFLEQIRTKWNSITGVRPCKKIVGELAKEIDALSQSNAAEFWDTLFAEVAASKFLTGQKSWKHDARPTHASLDWVTKPENLSKILAGNYDDAGIKKVYQKPQVAT